jgi:hypothetical protein
LHKMVKLRITGILENEAAYDPWRSALMPRLEKGVAQLATTAAAANVAPLSKCVLVREMRPLSAMRRC